MDAKVTLHFNQEVIEKAKAFAAANNISLSRLTEFIYHKITTGNYKTLENLPISDWVHQVAEGQAAYKKRSNKNIKAAYFKSKE